MELAKNTAFSALGFLKQHVVVISLILTFLLTKYYAFDFLSLAPAVANVLETTESVGIMLIIYFYSLYSCNQATSKSEKFKVEVDSLKSQNEGLRKNLMEVYNTVKTNQNGPHPPPPVPPQKLQPPRQQAQPSARPKESAPVEPLSKSQNLIPKKNSEERLPYDN